MDWNIKTDEPGLRVEIRLAGDCDLYSAPAFAKWALDGIEKGWRDIIVDFSELRYLDSTGVGALIRVLQALKRKGGSMISRGLKGPPRKVLEMSNILGLLGEEKGKGGPA